MKAKPAAKPVRPKPRPRVLVATPAIQPWWRKPDLWYVLGIFALAFAIYARSLSGPFLFDDSDILEARSAVRLNDWYIILTGPRPLLIFSYAFTHALVGFDPFYFHLVNVLLHAANAVILWRVVRLICNSPGLAGWATPQLRTALAYGLPLLFLASPIQTESVAYISSRSELLAATFYLLAVLVFLSSWRERRPWTTAIAIAVLYGCAVTSKQHALTLPGAILLADYFFLANRDWRQLKRNWPTYAVLGALMVAGGSMVVRAVINVPSAGFFLQEVTWKDYLFTQFRMYFLYLRLLLVPFGLNADWDIHPSRTLFQHGAWAALAGLILLAGAAFYFRRRFPLAAFGILFFLLVLFPSSSFYPLLDYAAERRLYLPAAGFFLAALALALEHRPRPPAVISALAALLIIYAAGTHSRNRVWQDGLALWEDTAAKSPGKWRAQNNLGEQYMQRKRFADAARAFQRAAELVPPNTKYQAEVLGNLGSTYANQRMYPEAVRNYEAALKITPENFMVWTNLAMAEVRLNRHEGWKHFEQAIHLNPLAWEPHFLRGGLYFEMGRYEEAIKDFQRVLDLRPDHPDAQYNLQAARAMLARQ